VNVFLGEKVWYATLSVVLMVVGDLVLMNVYHVELTDFAIHASKVAIHHRGKYHCSLNKNMMISK